MISEGRHLNQEAYILENELLKVCVLKNFGAKIASIYDKKKEYELLFQPSKGYYDIPLPNSDFSKYDTSGIDDTVPTIDSCLYPNTQIVLPDHGDVWSRRWEWKKEGSCLTAGISLSSLPLRLERRMQLKENRLKLSYLLSNETDKEYHYLWAFHGLNRFEEEVSLILPKRLEKIVNVKEEKEFDFEWKHLSSYPDKNSYKFYFTEPIEEGRIGLNYRKKGLSYLIHFDPSKLPYLGFWFTKGGFKGEYNCALEPCNGFYDALDRCMENGKSSVIQAFSEKRWKIEIEIKHMDKGEYNG